MRFAAVILLGLCAAAVAQKSDCASVAKTDKEIVLTATSWDPVYDIAATLADRYEISVSVESPRWAFPMDTEDVADADPQFSATHGNIHYRVMKRHTVQVRVPAGLVEPSNALRLSVRVVEAANLEMPYEYRVYVAGQGHYALVPTKTLTSDGLVDAEPLLDHRVTIPAGSRTIADHASLMAEQLSQTGLHVACCQASLAGVPWGLAEVTFETRNEPARLVLRKLIELEEQSMADAPNQHVKYDRWTVTCDGTGAPWCFIDVQGVHSAACR
jgi:hypothetical protein